MHLKKLLPLICICIACSNDVKKPEPIAEEPYTVYDRAYDYATNDDARVLALTDSIIAARLPEIEKAYFSKAVYQTKNKSAGDALRNFDLAIEARYNFLDAHLAKGIFLYEMEQFAYANKTFTRAIQIDPAVAEFYFWLAKTQQALGDKANAKSSYQKAFGLDKEMTEAKDSADKL